MSEVETIEVVESDEERAERVKRERREIEWKVQADFRKVTDQITLALEGLLEAQDKAEVAALGHILKRKLEQARAVLAPDPSMVSTYYREIKIFQDM